MKKQYEKPLMAVERYTLTQTIANCALEIGYNSADCVKADVDATPHMKDLAWDATSGGIGWFNDNSCAQQISEYINITGSTGEDGVCYHTNANAAFGST